MAIDYGITSLDTGASDIKYTGDEGPRSPEENRRIASAILGDESGDIASEIWSGMSSSERNEWGNIENFINSDDFKTILINLQTRRGPGNMRMASADPILQDEYDQYVFDLQENNPGARPMSIEAFREQAISGMASGGIARLGFQFGGHGGEATQGSVGAGQTSAGGAGEGQSGPGNIHFDVVEQARAQAAEVAQAKAQRDMQADIAAAEAKEIAQRNVALGDTVLTDYETIPFKESRLTAEQAAAEPFPDFGYDYQEYPIDRGIQEYPTDIHPEDPFAFEDKKTASQRAAQLAAEEAWDEKSPRQKELIQGRWDLGEEQFDTTDTGTDTTEGGLGEGITDTGIATDTGITAATAADTFEDAKAAAIAEAQAAAETRGLPFEHYYVGGDPTEAQEKFMQEHRAAASMVGREAWPAAQGGRARQRYGIGSLVKKAFKAVKKIAKSPIGMMALTAGLGGLPMFAGVGGAGAPKMSAWQKWLGPMLMGKPTGKGPGVEQGKFTGGIWNWIKDNPGWAIAGASALPFAFQSKYPTDVHPGTGDYGEGLDLLGIRKKILAKEGTQEEFPYLNPEYYAPSAQGGRIGYQNGRTARSIALNQLYGIAPKRKLAQEGGLMDLGGMEKDYRQEGGFVPIGGQERADDVPARLSKNEFVFTADAVRAAGGGDIDKGAEVMENVMDNLEQGGQVSQESQGLEGARNMFATAQRLEGVL